MQRVSRRKLINLLAGRRTGVALTTLVGTAGVQGANVDLTNEEQAAIAMPSARAFRGQHSPKPFRAASAHR